MTTTLHRLSHAMRHTPSRGSICMESRCEPDRWLIILDDEGPGLPPDQIERISARFVRGPDALGSGGSGLGLAITRSNVEAHGGTISASNRDIGGLRVTIRLPVRR